MYNKCIKERGAFMDICVYKKSYFKESSEVQKAITCAVSSLYSRITTYENQNVSFGKIFNDDRVKYDKHGDFYTFKYQKSNMQLRILYAYILINGTPVIIVADFVIKKKNNKDYIKQFEPASDWDPYAVYSSSKCILSC